MTEHETCTEPNPTSLKLPISHAVTRYGGPYDEIDEKFDYRALTPEKAREILDGAVTEQWTDDSEPIHTPEWMAKQMPAELSCDFDTAQIDLGSREITLSRQELLDLVYAVAGQMLGGALHALADYALKGRETNGAVVTRLKVAQAVIHPRQYADQPVAAQVAKNVGVDPGDLSRLGREFCQMTGFRSALFRKCNAPHSTQSAGRCKTLELKRATETLSGNSNHE